MHTLTLCLALLGMCFGVATVDIIKCPSHDITAYTHIVDSQTNTIRYTSENSILVLSDDHQVTYSGDNGKTWSTPAGLNGSVREIIIAPSNNQIVLFLGFGSENNLWTSTDGGKTVASKHSTTIHLTDVKFHPSDPEWAFALSRPGCRDQPECSIDLYFRFYNIISANAGQTWALIRKYIWVAAWHEGPEKVSKQNIVVWETADKTGNQYRKQFLTGNNVVKSDSLFRTDAVLLQEDVVGFLASNNHIFTAKFDRRRLQLYTSVDMGEHFHQVRFSESLSERSYTILDTSEGSSFIGVTHGINWANVYAGDSLDRDFTLSLSKTVRDNSGFDFRPFYGLEGIYLANVWTSTSSANPDEGIESKTLISYDKGGEWQPLTTKAGGLGSKINLLGPSQEGPGAFYSRREAVGIMFASGTIGTYLSANPSTHELYFTRDAGWSWTFAANGSHTYEIGNKGALVVAAKDEEPTKSFQYSLTEGADWVECPIFSASSTLAVDVENIISDPLISSTHFVLHGNLPDGRGVISVIDFSEVHERVCDSVHDDFELWEPSDREDGDECLLGRRVAYKRRKQTAACFLPSDFHVDGQFVSNCPCTYENYVCEFCFIRDSNSHKCVFDDKNEECKEYSPDVVYNHSCDNGAKNYTRSLGYRKTPGDSCDHTLPNSINLLPQSARCPITILGFSPSALLGTISLIVILVAVAITWYCAGTNEACRAGLTKVIPEKFLPDRRDVLPNAQYSQLGTPSDAEGDEDAREIHTDESDASEALQSS